MTVREIVTVGHPVLRERAREVTPDELASPETQQFIDDLIDTMRHANGGISNVMLGNHAQKVVKQTAESQSGNRQQMRKLF